MDHNKELLSAIFDNADIGKATLGKLIRKSPDATFRNAMAEQFAEYHNIACEAEKIAGETGVCCKCGGFYRVPIFASLYFNTAIDGTSTHMAEMIIQGSIQGIIDMTRHLREAQQADERITELAKKLLATEENNIRHMYDYL